MAKRKFSPERLWNCKYFSTRLCPNRQKEALWAIQNLVTEAPGGTPKSEKGGVSEKGKEWCAECKSFEPKKRR